MHAVTKQIKQHFLYQLHDVDMESKWEKNQRQD